MFEACAMRRVCAVSRTIRRAICHAVRQERKFLRKRRRNKRTYETLDQPWIVGVRPVIEDGLGYREAI